MQRRFPWFALVMMIIPAALMIINAVNAGAFQQVLGPNERVIWRFNPDWFFNNIIYLGILTLVFLFFGLRGFLRKMRELREFERFEDDGFLTYAKIVEMRSGSAVDRLPKSTVTVALTGGPDVKLKNLPYQAIVGRDMGDEMPVYALAGQPDQLVWAGWIDSPEEHSLESSSDVTQSGAARDVAEQASYGFAENFLNKVADRVADNEAVRDAIARSSTDGNLGFSTGLGAIHTKPARVGFFDIFIIGFLLIHGGIFFTVGSVFTFSGEMPWFFGGIFVLVGLVEFCIIAFVIFNIIKKISRRSRLAAFGESKRAIYQGSKPTNFKVNGVSRRAMILEIDGQTYQHGNFAPEKLSQYREGSEFDIQRDPNDHRSLFIPKL